MFESKTITKPDTKGPMAATFKRCVQVSPDDWDTIPQILKLKPETTVEEILQWWCDKNPRVLKFDGPIVIVRMEEE